MPCGLAPIGSLSAAVGIPADSENRTVTGVDGRAACGARVRFAASGEGVNVPEYITALACTGRNPGWIPPDNLSRVARRSGMSVDDMTESPDRVHCGH